MLGPRWPKADSSYFAVQLLSCVGLSVTPMDCSRSGFPVLRYLPEFVQVHVPWVSDAVQASHPVTPFSSFLQSFPASGSFPMTQLFASGGQSIRASASVSPCMNIQSWFPLRLTGLISLLSKRLLRVFSSTTIWKYKFFGIQPSLWFNSHILTQLLKKNHSFDYMELVW